MFDFFILLQEIIFKDFQISSFSLKVQYIFKNFDILSIQCTVVQEKKSCSPENFGESYHCDKQYGYFSILEKVNIIFLSIV